MKHDVGEDLTITSSQESWRARLQGESVNQEMQEDNVALRAAKNIGECQKHPGGKQGASDIRYSGEVRVVSASKQSLNQPPGQQT